MMNERQTKGIDNDEDDGITLPREVRLVVHGKGKREENEKCELYRRKVEDLEIVLRCNHVRLKKSIYLLHTSDSTKPLPHCNLHDCHG